MAIFEVVMWEQRRVAFRIEAEDAKHADMEAYAIWEGIDDDDTVDLLEELTAIDNHDIKSIQVFEIDANGQGREVQVDG